MIILQINTGRWNFIYSTIAFTWYQDHLNAMRYSQHLLNWRNWKRIQGCRSCQSYFDLKMRLWQVWSQGYAQSISFEGLRSKYQSPTDSAMVFLSLGEPGANQVSCLSDWQCAKQELINKPPTREPAIPLNSLSMSILKPCNTWSWLALQLAGFSLHECQWPWGSAVVGTKLLRICHESYAAFKMKSGVLICCNRCCGKKHLVASIREVHALGKFFAAPCIVTTPL